MLTQLQILEQTVLQIKNRYNITATELANLQQRIAQDTSGAQIDTLQQNLELANAQIDSLNAKIDELSMLNQQLTEQLANLNEQHQELVQKNQDLTDKNSLAISRVEIIQQWLNKIDNQNIVSQ